MSASKLATIRKSENNSTRETRSKLDTKRIVLSNIPNEINKEYLELYLEYLSDEIAVERFDFSTEIKNVILVTFIKSIDINRMKQKHENRPNCLHNKTDLEEVHTPDTILVEFEDDFDQNKSEENFNKELFELYFSNRKRSGGENISKCVYDAQKSRALITYETDEIAYRVSNKSHQINNKSVSVSLFYTKIGKDPFKDLNKTNHTTSTSLSSSTTRSSVATTSITSSARNSTSTTSSLSSGASLTKNKKTVSIDNNAIFKMEKKFDPKLLSQQQCNYLIELQSIYNELNGSHLNIFKSTPPPPPVKPQILNKKQIFKSDLQLSQIKEVESKKPFYLTKDKSFSSNNLSDKKSKIYHKSMPDGLDLKRKSEFNSCLSLNLTAGPTSLNGIKIKTSSSQSLKKVTNIKQADTAVPAIKLKNTLSSTAISSKNKPQKVIYKNKERPPPPKLIKSLKTSDEDEENERTRPVDSPVIEETKKSKYPLVPLVSQLKKNTPQRTNSMFSLHRESGSITSDENILKSIVKNKSIVLTQQPKQTIIKFTDDLSSDDLNDKENESSRVVTSISSAQRAICSRTSNKLYKANLAKRNLQSLYGPTINESLNKLTATQIDFIQSTKYLNKLKASFPKVNINLNEKMRNLYFFGTSTQVIEAKSRVVYDLELIKQTSYEIEQKELADYLKKSEPRQKILKFIESIINRHQYHRLGKNVKFKSLENQAIRSSSANYCSYQIGLSKRDPNKSILIVNTNMDNMAQFLHKLLNESIRVNQLINIYNTDIVDYIINSDPEWLDFYDIKFKNNVDFTLIKTDSKDSNWSLKITGFKEYVDKFIIDFRNKFD